MPYSKYGVGHTTDIFLSENHESKGKLFLIAFITLALCLLICVPPAVLAANTSEDLAYDELISSTEGSGYKKTDAMADADKSDQTQKNYQSTSSEKDSKTEKYLLSSVSWTNYEKGEATLTVKGALAGKEKEYSTYPLYTFTTCTAHGFNQTVATRNINKLIELYGGVTCKPLNGSGDVQPDKLFTAENSSEIASYLSSLNFGGGSRCFALGCAAAIKTHLFGSKEAPCDNDHLQNMPAAIYITADHYYYKASTYMTREQYNEFYKWIYDNYVRNQKRYFSATKNENGYATSGITDANYSTDGPDTIADLAGLFDPTTYKDGTYNGETVHVDMGYDKDFEAVGMEEVEVYPFSEECVVASDFDIVGTPSAKINGSFGSTNPQVKVEDHKITGYVEEYAYGDELEITANIKVNPSSTAFNGEWVDVFSGGASSEYGVSSLKIDSPKLANKPHISIEKTADKELVQPGDTIHYTVVVSNPGASLLNNALFEDAVPSNLSVNADSVKVSSGTATVSQTVPTVSANALTLAPDESYTVEFDAVVSDSTQPGVITNEASASADGSDKVSANVSTNVDIPKLILTKTDDKEYAQPGDTVHYIIKVENNGTVEARNVNVEDELPEVLIPVGEPTTTTGVAAFTDNMLTHTIDAIPAGESVTVEFDTQLVEDTMPNSYTNTAKAVADHADEVNGSDSFEVVIPELKMTKGASVESIQVGESFDYTIKIANFAENSTSLRTIVRDAVPDTLTITSEPTMTIDDTDMVADDTSEGERNEEPVPSEDENSGENAGDTAESFSLFSLFNDIYNFFVGEKNSVYADDAQTTEQQDEQLGDTSDERNSGGSEQDPVNDSDNANNGETNGEDTGNGENSENQSNGGGTTSDIPEVGTCSVDGQNIIANVGNLVYGKQATITFTVQVNETDETSILNTANASATNHDEITADATVNVLKPVLYLAKYVGTEDQPIDVSIAEQPQISAQVGQDVDYKIIVEQTTEGAVAKEVNIADMLPDQLQLTGTPMISGSESAELSSDPHSVSAIIPELKYDEQIVIDFKANVVEYSEERVVNTASVSAQFLDELEAQASLFISSLSITKTPSTDNVNVGETFDYTIEVGQAAPNATSYDVVVVDDVPEGLSIQGTPEISGIAAQGTATVEGQKITVSIPQLTSGEKAKITFTVSVDSTLGGQDVVNNVSATAKSIEPPVVASAKVAVAKVLAKTSDILSSFFG